MRHRHLATAALAGLALVPASAAAAPFSAPTPITGFGAQPQLAGVSDSAAAPNGASIVAGTRSVGNQRQVVVALGAPGRAPATAHALRGAAIITSQPQVGISDAGRAAVVWSEGSVAFLATCANGQCTTPRTVGRSALKAQPAVAMQPNGRTTVMWRGHTSRGNRLQWRITTNGKLGRTHTLGEFGNQPQLGTDASGKTVALWSRYVTSSRSPMGIRTAARRAGEFTRPTTLFSGRVTSGQLETGARGLTYAAWVAPDANAVLASSRTANTRFAAPQTVVGGDARTVDLATSSSGFGALAIGRAAGSFDVTVWASVASPGGNFSQPVNVGGGQFISDLDPALAAVTAGGTTTIAWVGQPNPTSQYPAQAFASSATPGGPFSSPQMVSDQATVQAGGATLAAAGDLTQFAFVGPSAVLVARAVAG